MSKTPQTEAMRLAAVLDSDEFDLSVSGRKSAAAELRRLDAVEAENKRLKNRLDFHLERSAQREQRLWVWAHEELSEPLKTRYFNIVANGTADVMEQPVYAQQFNIMRHRAEAAEAEREQLREALQKIMNWNCHTTNYAVRFGSNGVRDFYREIARQTLATTEPAVNQQLTTGPVDELPEPHAVITGKLGAHCSFNSNELRKGDPIYTADRVQAYGKRCWSAGFRHGDFSDENISYLAQIRDAVAEICPGASEGLLMNAIGGPCEVPRYVIDVMQELKQDAERYRWLASSESVAMNAKSKDHQCAISDAWTTLEKLDADKALIDAAIDAAMAKGVKG